MLEIGVKRRDEKNGSTGPISNGGSVPTHWAGSDWPYRQKAKPKPRWDVHLGGLEDELKDSTAPHITFMPNWG